MKSGCSEEYRGHSIKQGQKDAQFKPIPLQYKDELSFDLDNYILE